MADSESSARDSWEYQGRQQHGWFGHGTAPPGGDAAGEARTPGSGIDEVIHGAVAARPAAARPRFERILADGGLGALRAALQAWAAAADADSTAFQTRFFGNTLGEAGASALREVARLAAEARTQQARREAAGALAEAVTMIGFDRLPGVPAEAGRRAPATSEGGNGTGGSAAAPPPPHVAPDPTGFLGGPSIGDGECVALVKKAAGMPLTPEWKQGEPVMGNTKLPTGTIIATFDGNGRYSGHAAIYMGQDERGLIVIDQWNIRDKITRQVTKHLDPQYRTLPWASPCKQAIDIGSSYHVVR